MSAAPWSFRGLVETAAGRDGARPFFTFGGRTWTVAEMDTGANRVANALRSLGIARGDRVAVLLPNGPEIVWCWWGLAKLSAVYIPVNTHLAGPSLAHVLAHSEARALVADAALLTAVDAALETWPPTLRHVVAVAAPHTPADQGARDDGRQRGEVNFMEQLLATATPTPPPSIDQRPEDPALIIYTSGTTGAPKGVLWSRRAQTEHARRYAAELSCAEPGESVYTCLPLFHVTSIGVVMSSLLRGSRVAVDRAFDPFGHWQRVREEGAVLFPYVGAMLGLLDKRPERPDDADNPVRWAMGAAAPKELWRRFEQRFQLRLVETYGQTEFAGNWLMPSPEGSSVGTVGQPPPRLEARIVNDQDQPVPDGVPGELVVRARAPHLLMEGYYKQPDATAQAFRDGWYHTGDRLSRDAGGYFTYHGRLKDFIRHRGENVSAFEVERVASAHPGVLECAAVGVPAEVGEEDVLLCVVRRPDSVAGGAIDAATLYAYCHERLPPFMIPRYVRFLDALPKTATTRVQKFSLAAEGVAGAWDRQARRSGQSGRNHVPRTRRRQETARV